MLIISWFLNTFNTFKMYSAVILYTKYLIVQIIVEITLSKYVVSTL